MDISSLLSSSLYSSYTASSSSSTNDTDFLSEEDQTTLDSILANYDASSMTDEDYQSLIEDLKAADIEPTEAVKQYIADAGFDVPEPPEIPQAPSLAEILSESDDDDDSFTGMSNVLSDFLEQYKAGNITDSDISTLLSSLENQNLSTTGVAVDSLV